MRHSINGAVFGPGRVTLSSELAQELLQTEQASREAEERLYGSRGFLIGPRTQTGHTIREVPAELFNSGDDDTRELTYEEWLDRVHYKPPEAQWKSVF